MGTTTYSYNIDLEQLHTSHTLAVLSVRPGSRVLDLGAADGSVARALKARGCTVWAIEQDEQAAQAARAICDRVLIADLELEEVWGALAGETFDVILALDVLEHLRQGAPVLRHASRHLTTNGVVIVSLPNVTHGSLRLHLLRGRFKYTPTGLLDQTHLRFFDRDSAEKLVADGGLVISERLRTTRKLEETEIPVVKDEIPSGFVELLEQDPDAITYQFVFVAHRAADGAPESTGVMLSERLLHENEALREQLLELAVKDAIIADLRSELQTARAMVENLTTERHRLALHQQELESSLASLRTYANSAGFRLAEKAIVALKRAPFLFQPIRSLVRAAAGRPDHRP